MRISNPIRLASVLSPSRIFHKLLKNMYLRMDHEPAAQAQHILSTKKESQIKIENVNNNHK